MVSKLRLSRRAWKDTRRDSRRRSLAILYYLTASSVALLFLLPLIWILAASLRQTGLPPPRGIEWLPQPVSWRNYPAVFALLPFGRYTLNSLWVAAVAVPLTLLTASWAGLGMALFDRRTRHRLLLLSCGLLFIPTTALWLTRFSLLTWLGLGNTHLALIAPAFAGSSPFFVLLFYWAFRRVPDELYEAALLNGANVLMLWARIAIPLSLPTTIVVGALAFWHYWSDFLSPLMFLQSQALYTLPVGLQQLLQLDASNWPILMAGAAVLAGPAIVVFALLQPFLTPSSGHTPPQ